jgi:hypothetical protein
MAKPTLRPSGRVKPGLRRMKYQLVALLSAAMSTHAVVALAQRSAAAAFQLDPLHAAAVLDFHLRVPGCRVQVTVLPDRNIMAEVADADKVLLKTSKTPLELPIVRKDNGESGSMIAFGAISDRLGGRVEGSLTSLGDGKACRRGDQCMEIPAHMKIVFSHSQTVVHTIFDADVTVIDHCGTDPDKRLFSAGSWLGRFMRMVDPRSVMN